MSIVVEVEPKIKERTRDRGVVNRDTSLIQVPAPRSIPNYEQPRIRKVLKRTEQ